LDLGLIRTQIPSFFSLAIFVLSSLFVQTACGFYFLGSYMFSKKIRKQYVLSFITLLSFIIPECVPTMAAALNVCGDDA
jgi:biotin transporter BioY